MAKFVWMFVGAMLVVFLYAVARLGTTSVAPPVECLELEPVK